MTTPTISVTEKRTLDTQSHVSKGDWHFLAAFGCLSLINLMCAIDATILSVALPTVVNGVQLLLSSDIRTGTSFLLTSTVFQPSWASFSHIFGRKPILLLALSLFTLRAIIAALANNFTLLLVGRSIQGISGGGLIALTYVIVTDIVTLRDRGKWFSIISLQWAIGSVTGPVIGGVFAEKSTWRWIFWLNIPFCFVAFITIPISLKLNHKDGLIIEKLKAIDWIGTVLFGGVMYDWKSWRTLFPLIISFMGMIFFLFYSKYFASEPLIKGSIFHKATAKVGYFGTFIHGVIIWSLLYYMPLYYEVAKDFNFIESGIAIFPFTFTTAPATIVVGFIITKTRKYRPSIIFGLGLLIILKEDTTTPQWIFLSLAAGLGTGILYSAQSFAVQASASNLDLPYAAAMYSFFGSLGQTFGVACGGAIFQNAFKHKLSLNPILSPKSTQWARDASAIVQIMKSLPDSNEIKGEIVATYVDSFKVIWIVMCVLASVTFLLSLIFVKDISLNRELETEQGFRYKARSSPRSGI
ncbi:major facilitator superfamily domain-containing protein [Leptodontidium sp. MPI-SDFR-AT-0119]|nr:major facilitator superfamily domain-containing protein [Leptodontidium sp. MPI-SDFR-AT-0119]